ncbi:MAG: hypothetical protein KA758_18720 [Acidimicrobiales bacterium]|nr:hypothetical protein [Acidimicrobiales bacterium]
MTDTLPINPTPWPLAADKVAGHWTQGAMRDGDRMCLVGGLETCGLAPGEWLIARAVARRRGHGEQWNDEPSRTEEEVVGWLRTAQPITPGELADVFGPQWEHVCALVLRASRLNAVEGRELDAAGAAAWAAARDAAGAAARDAAWDAAWGAAGAAAWDVARGAAGAAARALVVRDLIGQHGFTQDHYDILARPWRAAIGPLHPDDGPLT